MLLIVGSSSLKQSLHILLALLVFRSSCFFTLVGLVVASSFGLLLLGLVPKSLVYNLINWPCSCCSAPCLLFCSVNCCFAWLIGPATLVGLFLFTGLLDFVGLLGCWILLKITTVICFPVSVGHCFALGCLFTLIFALDCLIWVLWLVEILILVKLLVSD